MCSAPGHATVLTPFLSYFLSLLHYLSAFFSIALSLSLSLTLNVRCQLQYIRTPLRTVEIDSRGRYAARLTTVVAALQ